MKSAPSSWTRRAFLGQVTAAGLGASSLTQQVDAKSSTSASPLNLLRPPDSVIAYAGLNNGFTLTNNGRRWIARSVAIETPPESGDLPIYLSAPEEELTHLHLRWNEVVSSSLLLLGDAWERSYGDLGWRSLAPERPFPWYFATADRTTTDTLIHGYGVRTGAGAFCFWQLDPQGVSLWLDVSNGGNGVLLGERKLHAATVVVRRGHAGEEPISAVRELCRQMCPRPRPSQGPIYGSNDWYYAYGNSSQNLILRDADLMASLRPAKASKPFTIIDDGWTNKAKFPGMAGLAGRIRQKDVRPGIWLRPLIAPANTDPGLLLPAARFGERASRAKDLAYDPTHPEALRKVTDKIAAIREWGYELLKHDYSSYDLLGQWGFEMGARPTLPGWSFHDRSKTNTEIVSDFYNAIRRATGEPMLILGCNTVGHLGAGVFDLQRTGDDTSGKLWERTRRMGVNTLAFRLPQHGSFFSVDADCVAITSAIPWKLTQQWLEVVARSGTALFVSPEAAAIGPEQKKALAEAFIIATTPGSSSVPVDWYGDTTPQSWIDKGSKQQYAYRWCEPEGAWPFSI